MIMSYCLQEFCVNVKATTKVLTPQLDGTPRPLLPVTVTHRLDGSIKLYHGPQTVRIHPVRFCDVIGSPP